MKSSQLLSSKWVIWLSFSTGKKQLTSYDNNLIKYLQIKSWGDVAYIWTHSDIQCPSNYFTDPISGQYTKHEINGEMRKIQSIDIFKGDVQPTWEFGDNCKGGYFRFSLVKEVTSQKVQQVYQSLVFISLGNTLSICNNLIGIRIVDSMSKKKYRCRFELWVDYKDDDKNLQLIKRQAEQIKQLIGKIQIIINDIQFFNIYAKIKIISKEDQNTCV